MSDADHLGDIEATVLYVLRRFSRVAAATSGPHLTNDEIMMLMCLLENRGEIERVWRVTQEGKRRENESARSCGTGKRDIELLAKARQMARDIQRS